MIRIHNKNQDFMQIEECFSYIKKGQNVEGNLKRISSILSRNFNSKEFKISIVENRNTFFGMSCYPSKSDIDILVDKILSNQKHSSIVSVYTNISHWIIEIDSLLLYDRNLNANPGEITAVLLHEIGHIVYSDSIPNRLTKVILLDYLMLNNRIKSLVQNKRLQSILGITAIETFALKSFSSNPSKSEYVADKFAVKYGYGTDLDNFVDKLLKTHGSSLIDRSEKQMEQELKLINQWAIENISELQHRKTKLKAMLKTEMLSTPSPYVKEYVKMVRTLFFGTDGDELVKQMLVEQSLMRSYNTIVQESFIPLFDKLGRVKKVNQSDIDDIFIDVQRMDNFDDALYTMGKIRDLLEITDRALEVLETGDPHHKVQQSKTSVLNMKKQLEDLRVDVLKKKFNTNRKVVLINYPEGYEG